MTTYYVSSEASNGYVVGDDGNAGTSKTSPWLTLDNISSAGGSHTVELNGAIGTTGAITVTGDLVLNGNGGSLTIGGTPAFGIICQTAGKTIEINDLTIDTTNCTSGAFAIGNATTVVTFSMTDVDVEFAVLGIAGATNAILDATLTRTSWACSGNVTGAIQLVSLAATTSIVIDTLELNMDCGTIANTYGGVVLVAVAADVTAEVSGVTGTIKRTSGTTYIHAVRISDCAEAVIENCDVFIDSSVASSSANLYKITSASQAVTSAVIRNNRGSTNAPGGILIIGGEDGTANECDGVQIYGNSVSGRPDYTTLHGIAVGGNENARVYNNRVSYAFIPFLAKAATGALVHHNVSEFVKATGSHYYLKGCTTSEFTANLAIASGAYNGYGLYADKNGAADNSGCKFTGNAVYAYPGTTATFYYCVVGTDQGAEVTWTGNVYWTPGGLSGNVFLDEGTARALAGWIAQSHVVNDVSFEFAGRLRNRINNRLLVSQGVAV